MEKYPFLSPEWIERVRDIRQAYSVQSDTPSVDVAIRMNQIVTDVPFGDSEVKIYIDSSEGFIDIELGELEDAEITIRIDYETAKSIFVDLDFQVAMTAFMAGKIRVTGDFTKLIALQSAFSPESLSPNEIVAKIKDLTS
ncbi:SCP2 sterol-binding domain-containing protein [Acidithrix ferrooxidans]|uniref:SCP-2 sterol transfer family protein n=2 Tax=root TaxID=1 RepID=A0A0D8HF17_9ACTN|nr:hypothetical protein [Acidithrix ferrooxidans]KJF16464.1 hypothetical protein AXFE_26940 [Acidithrix ferrooxidans]